MHKKLYFENITYSEILGLWLGNIILQCLIKDGRINLNQWEESISPPKIHKIFVKCSSPKASVRKLLLGKPNAFYLNHLQHIRDMGPRPH